jgi:hypothetical protein
MRYSVLMLLFIPVLAMGHGGEFFTLGFDGAKTHVEVVDRTIGLSSDFTVECLVKFNTLEREQVIMAKTENPGAANVSTWEFGLWKRSGGGEEDNTLWFVVGSGTNGSAQHLQSMTTFTVGRWYHISAVMNKTTMLLYIDGKLEASGEFKLKRRSDLNGNLTFGASPEYSAALAKDGSLFNGELDEVRLWGTARSEAQIQGWSSLGLKGDEAGLQAYYTMSNGNGETLDDDQKDGKNRGVIYSGTWLKAGALPVTLISFSGKYFDAQTSLQWSTASEVNNYGFEVERRDGSAVAWTIVGFVAGNGTTVEGHAFSFTDATVAPGGHAYRLKQIDLDGTVHYSDPIVLDVPAGLTGVASLETVPLTTTLAQNYPNPFNPSTMIEFTVAKTGLAKLTVYDLLGREVAVLADGEFMSGMRHRVQFDASRLTSGMYFYRLTAGEAVAVHSLILTK